MLGHPKGRGRNTPIFWQKLKLIFLQNSFTIEWRLMINKNFQTFPVMFSHPKGRGRTTPFMASIEV